jgi:hypothetical protein
MDMGLIFGGLMIIKSLPRLVEPEFKLTQDTEKIGDTLFVNGVPHRMCGRCGKAIGSEANERIMRSTGATKSKGKIVKDGKVTYEVKEYRIQICSGWIKLGEEIIYVNGFPTVKEKFAPKLTQKPGCFDCWDLQQRRGDWFKDDECIGGG